MPDFFREYLENLSREQADKLAEWADFTPDADIAIVQVINSRPDHQCEMLN